MDRPGTKSRFSPPHSASDGPPLYLQHRSAKEPDYGLVWLVGLEESAMCVKLLRVYSWTLLTGLGEAVSRILSSSHAQAVSCSPIITARERARLPLKMLVYRFALLVW